ncbi:Uncharacterised protein [Legionella busanensis]|uniref:Uncharacterized protein n=1 Tax=Legionella busanensis TaxID=190655 RepID=A0A378KAR6_9GAMM|nr:hypothetical protein [Legionella busanensis]STX81273.1 Uncharacterised protein [Legionella busanensis]
MNEQDVLTLRLTPKEMEYLHNLADKHDLKKRGNDELSPAKALKFLLAYCLHHEIKTNKNEEEDLLVIRKMIEQIHASIPHLLFQNQFQSLLMANQFKSEDINIVKQSTLQYLNDNFSGFQSLSYKEVKFKINGIGLKTIPLEQGISLWK